MKNNKTQASNCYNNRGSGGVETPFDHMLTNSLNKASPSCLELPKGAIKAFHIELMKMMKSQDNNALGVVTKNGGFVGTCLTLHFNSSNDYLSSQIVNMRATDHNRVCYT